MQHRTTRSQALSSRLRRHWLPLLLAGFFGIVLLAGSPAWAAPVARPLNQTVPRPTPTPEFSPVPTATPLPAATDAPSGGNQSDSGSSSGSNESGDSTANEGEPGEGPEADPSDLFPAVPAPETEGAGELTATVGVGALNVREGPGTTFNVVGSLAATTQVTVRARNEDATWWYICCLPGTTNAGWASSLLLNPDFERSQAQTLLPLFGTQPAAPLSVQPITTTTQPRLIQAPQPLALGFSIDPPFVWQGITATLTVSVSNPNAIDVVAAELSDELPPALTLLAARADAGGAVETIITPSGRPLLIFRWALIPAGTGVSATIIVDVTEDLDPGVVVDNLVGVRARNAAYNAGAFTIGMPPLFPPVFD